MLFNAKGLVLTVMRRWGSLRAQINKMDMSTLRRLAETDAKMIDHRNVWYYFKYTFLTVFGKGFWDRVRR
jgi:lipopolysaccharide/colanic/teichoic acid biosynthesis glycosyltransferase